MFHLGVSQLIRVYQFSLLCEMDESSSRFRIPKTPDEENASIINSVPKSTVYKNKWAIQIFWEWQVQRENKLCSIERGGVFKAEDTDLGVQELTESTENMNCQSLIYFKLIYWCHIIFRESVDIWILYPNLYRFGYNIQIFKDFHPVFHWVSKHMHVMWYTCSDL